MDHLGPPKSIKITKTLKNKLENTENLIVEYCFPPEWNFDIDAGDGELGGQIPKIPKISTKNKHA